MTHEVELWTDGSGTASGPLGFAWILVHVRTGVARKGEGGAVEGTSQRAEMMAAIYGLSELKRPTRVQIITDSEYVMKAFTDGWLANWKWRNWPVRIKNKDLWQWLDRLVGQHTVTWRWVKGHNKTKLNEDCDDRAGMCRQSIKDMLAGAGAGALGTLPFPVVESSPQGTLV